MATQYKKTVNQPEQNGSYLHKDNWEVMKPFVRFAFKAIALIGGTLLAIIKLVPKAIEHKHNEGKGDKVIKI